MGDGVASRWAVRRQLPDRGWLGGTVAPWRDPTLRQCGQSGIGGACRVAVRRCGHSEHGGVSGSVAPRRDPTLRQCGIAVIAAEVAAYWVGRGQYGATLLVPIFF